MTGSLKSFPSTTALVHETAGWIAGVLDREVRNRGVATLVLSGGSTPQQVYRLLGSGPREGRLPWEHVHLFWGDERCVPPDHRESNFRMVHESLLSVANIPCANIHRIQAERPPADAAADYEQEIRTLGGIAEDDLPRFTIVLLGLGTDGHTASLFPGTSALLERRRLVTEVYVQSLANWRITMTLPVINNAAAVLFLVSGGAKAGILRSVLEEEPPRYPAQLVSPSRGELLWYADAEASAQLTAVNNP